MHSHAEHGNEGDHKDRPYITEKAGEGDSLHPAQYSGPLKAPKQRQKGEYHMEKNLARCIRLAVAAVIMVALLGCGLELADQTAGSPAKHPGEQWPIYNCGARTVAICFELVKAYGMENVQVRLGTATWGQRHWHAQAQYREHKDAPWQWVLGIEKDGTIITGGPEHFDPLLTMDLYQFIRWEAEKQQECRERNQE